MTLQAWATRHQRNSPSLGSPEIKLAIPLLDSVIKGSTASDQAAISIAEIYNNRILLRGDHSSPHGLWRIVCAAVDLCGNDNDVLTRLIRLILSLSKINVTDENGHSVQSDMNNDTFWRQLPGFAPVYREELLLHIHNIQDLGDDDMFEEEKHRFTNAAAFQARWMAEVGRTGPNREWKSATNYALWLIPAAIEVSYVSSDIGVRRVSLWLPQAVRWFLVAGRTIYLLCRTEVRKENSPARAWGQSDDGVDGYLFKGVEGFSLGRWALWKSRFGHIAGMDLKPELKALANEARDKMEEIENQALRTQIGALLF